MPRAPQLTAGDLTARDLVPPPAGTPWTEAARTLDLTARHVPVTPELFERLPPELQTYQKDYRPSGPMTVRLVFNRLARPSLRLRLRPPQQSFRQR